MSSEIWKIGQETNAEKFYEKAKNLGIFKSDVVAVNRLTQICNIMTEAYDEILDDQNEYLIDLNNEEINFQNLKDDIDEKIKKLYSEIKELEKKEQNGTISEEEQKELEDKKGELKTVMVDSDTKINNEVNSVKAKGETRIQEHKSKIAVAKNYGEVTVDKGTPLSETKVKTKSFWRSIFGGTGAEKKEVGDKAVEAGNNLLDKVNESVEINANIENNYKKIKA